MKAEQILGRADLHAELKEAWAMLQKFPGSSERRLSLSIQHQHGYILARVDAFEGWGMDGSPISAVRELERAMNDQGKITQRRKELQTDIAALQAQLDALTTPTAPEMTPALGEAYVSHITYR